MGSGEHKIPGPLCEQGLEDSDRSLVMQKAQAKAGPDQTASLGSFRNSHNH